MIVNQANLHGLTVGYSTAFNKSLEETQANYQKVATVVPSSTGEQDYKWLGQMPSMKEWIGEREIQAIEAYDYLIKNKKFEKTYVEPREDIEDDKYGVYTPLIENIGEDAGILYPRHQPFGHQKIVNTPSRILFPRVEPVAPPRIRPFQARMQTPEGIREACAQQFGHLSALLVGEPSVAAVGFRVFQVDFFMGDIHIAAHHDRLLLIKRTEVPPERVFPLHPVIQTFQPILGIGRVHCHKIKILVFRRYDTPLVVMLFDPEPEADRKGL